MRGRPRRTEYLDGFPGYDISSLIHAPLSQVSEEAATLEGLSSTGGDSAAVQRRRRNFTCIPVTYASVCTSRATS
jgi:hypothetical protein